MENQKVSPWKGNFNWGLIMGFSMIIFSTVLYFLDQIGNQKLGYISMIIMVVVLFLGIKAYRDTFLGGYITYGQVLGAGVIIGLYSAVISGLFTILLYKFIDPDLVNKLYAISENKMLEQGVSEGQIEVAMKLTKKFLNPYIMAAMGLFSSPFMAFIFSLILGIFMKNEGEKNPVETTEAAE